MDYYEDFNEWLRDLVYDGCAARKDSRGIYWAENWLGRCCGEFNPVTNTGFLDYSKS